MVVEIATTHRVYRKEWLLEGMFETEQSAHEHLAQRYEGRLEPENMTVDQTSAKDAWSAGAKQWNVVGEFKRQQLAEAYMEALIAEGSDASEMRTVERNSRAEQVLKNYGVLLLPKS